MVFADIIFVFLFSPPWRWSYKWLNHVFYVLSSVDSVVFFSRG
jgi:hypothetical protein